MIYFYVHLFDGNFHASCYYQSTVQTERGEAFRGKEGMVKEDSPGKDNLATEGSEITQ